MFLNAKLWEMIDVHFCGTFSIFLDNFYKVEGAKDALICGYGSDAG